MSALRLLSNTVNQISSRLGSRMSPQGVAVAAMLALAAAPSMAQSSFDLHRAGDGSLRSSWEPPGPPRQQAPQRQVEPIVQQGVGSILGYTVGRALKADSTGKAVLAVLGWHVAGQMARADTPQSAPGASGNAPVARGPGQGAPGVAPGAPIGIALTPEIHARMQGMVMDAAAARLLAQEAVAALDRAEIDQVTLPGDAAARQAVADRTAAVQRSMQDLRTTLSPLSNAVQVLQGKGYEVRDFAQAFAALSTRVEKANFLSFEGHQEIERRVNERRLRQSDSILGLSEQGEQQAQRQRMATP